MKDARWEIGRKVRIRRAGVVSDICMSVELKLWQRSLSAVGGRLKERKAKSRTAPLPNERVVWEVVDEKTGVAGRRFDSFEAAKRFCVKNGFDFGQYGRRRYNREERKTK